MAISAKDVQIGQELPSTSKKMTIETMIAMGGGNPIHWDKERTDREGLQAPIATGMISTGWLSHQLTVLFGEDWVKGGRLANTYIAPVYEGDTVTTKAVVKEKAPEDSGARVVMEVWCENQNGQRVTVGEASVLLR